MKSRVDLSLPIKTTVEDGQPYVDEAVLKEAPVYCAKEPMTVKLLSHYKRIPLRWVKPGHDGKLVPR